MLRCLEGLGRCSYNSPNKNTFFEHKCSGMFSVGFGQVLDIFLDDLGGGFLGHVWEVLGGVLRGFWVVFWEGF